MPDISIVDTRNIIRAAKQQYDIDLSQLSLTSLRFKLDRIIKQQHIRYVDILINHILEEKDFFHEFIHELFYTDVELFRDPELWFHIKSTLLLQHNGLFNNFKIWIPNCNNGNEIISMIILLEESDLLKQSKIYFSSHTKFTCEKIFDLKENFFIDKDISYENFHILFPDVDIQKYFDKKNNKYYFKNSWMGNIFNIQQGFLFKPDTAPFNLILCRNKLLNFSLSTQNIILSNLFKVLEKNGMIILGYRENIEDFQQKNDYVGIVNKDENIFKKK